MVWILGHYFIWSEIGREKSVAVGHTNILHDEDGFVRRAPTIITVEGERYPSLALAAIQTYLALGANSEMAEIPEPVDGYLEMVGRQIPVGESGDMNIYYAGPPAQADATTFQTVSYQAVLNQEVDDALFQDKIVLIGMTATAEPDRYLTPISRGRPMRTSSNLSGPAGSSSGVMSP